MRSNRTSIRLQLEELESRLVLSTYDVGPGQAYTALGQVDWNHLQAGDVVRIHWQPTPYHEKVQIAARGTQSAPIQIIGVAGPNGQLPVIAGDGAVSNPGTHFSYAPLEGNGGFIIAPHGDETDPNYKAGWIDIENLDIENFNSSNSYTAADGTTHTYNPGVAGITMYDAEHIVIQGCVIHGNENGIFGKSFGYEQGTLRDILVDGNTIYGNGKVGSNRAHNSYLEGVGVIYQYNHFGPEIAGALGSDIKDRSAGTIIRYNWLEGGAHILDLVEVEDGGDIISKDPSFANTLVYGNIIYNPPASSASIIHFGGDLGDPAYYRTNLYLYNNTIVNRDDQQTGYWHTSLVSMEGPQQTAWVRNNIIFNESATPGETPSELTFCDTDGTVHLSTNWVSAGVLPSNPSYPLNGLVDGLGQLLVGTDPGFVNNVSDFHLRADSAGLGRAVALDPAVMSYPVLSEYTPPANDPLQTTPPSGPDRPAVTNATNLGGFQGPSNGGGSGGGGQSGGGSGGGQPSSPPTMTSSSTSTVSVQPLAALNMLLAANQALNNQLLLEFALFAGGRDQVGALFFASFGLAGGQSSPEATRLINDEQALAQRLVTALTDLQHAGPALADITALTADIHANPLFNTTIGYVLAVSAGAWFL
jgi:hypothetical protein